MINIHILLKNKDRIVSLCVLIGCNSYFPLNQVVLSLNILLLLLTPDVLDDLLDDDEECHDVSDNTLDYGGRQKRESCK